MSKEYPTPGELFSLEGDVAVVTGGGRGIGEGIARTLASAGAKVVVAARRVHEIEAVAAAIRADGGQAIAVETDVTSDEAMENLAKAAVKEFGKLSRLHKPAKCSAVLQVHQESLVELPVLFLIRATPEISSLATFLLRHAQTPVGLRCS